VNDLIILIVAGSIFCFALAIGGALADWLDPYDEAEDARRRNGR
jgi:hypothetical protein